jgi:hypothetical protein
LHCFWQKNPTHRIKGLGYVELNEEGWAFGLMEGLDHVMDIQEIIMDASLFYERILASRHTLI